MPRLRDALEARTRENEARSLNDKLCKACKLGQNDVVSKMLNDVRVDPSLYDNKALMYATKSGHKIIMDMLMLDSRVVASLVHNAL